MKFDLHNGDVRDVLQRYPDNSFDGCFCDPPYGFSFMGKKWDYAVPSVETWKEVLRVLKPGAPFLSFGGPKTYHRVAVNIEDAGFELRDCLHWIFGQGFPKSQNTSKALDKAAGATREIIGYQTLSGNAAVSTKDKGGTYGVQAGSAPAIQVPLTAPATDLAKQWEGYGSALKPSFEPICLARKPLSGTMVENVKAYGVGPLNVDGTRIGKPENDVSGWSKSGSKASENLAMTGANYDRSPKPDAPGRWPANLILDEDAGATLDALFGNKKGMSGGGMHKKSYLGGMFGGIDSPTTARNDNGGASRFFYCSKVSTKERNAGLQHPNDHPTLKPISLTTWLATLIKPPTYCRLLVPFCGTGSEIIGAGLAGWDECVGIDQDASYLTKAALRIEHHLRSA